MPTFSLHRAAAILGVLGMLLLGMTARVAYLQTWGRERTLRSAERQQHQQETLYARRGTIFDSTGTVMAGTVQNQDLFVDAKFLADYYSADDKDYNEYLHTIATLAGLIDMPQAQLATLLSDHSEARYLKVKENIDEGIAAGMQTRIAKLKLKGVGFTPCSQRYYPMGSLAAHILGGTRTNGHGLDGLEMHFDDLLAGHDGYKRTLKDAQRNPIAVDADDYRPAEHGRHLILTIDANIQLMAEQELAATCQEFHAQTGEIVVMDPRNGDVLAMANYPTFNPQNLEDSTPDLRRNRVLVSPYEPGSTIKPFIAGPALSWHVTRPEEIFHTNGAHYITPYGRKITDVHNGYPQLAMWDVLVKSSNIGMSMLGERMGNEKIWKALTNFGFGEKTGIDLPGESHGKVNPLKEWNKYSTESCAQGYELMVTPLQLARGFCAYANGGRLLKPRIIKGLLDADGNTISEEKQTGVTLYRQAIDAQTAQQVRRILCDVVVRGTATAARSKVWNIFGKTGTAHISEGPGKGYSDHLFNSSFIAGCPAESPRLVVAFIVHKPDAPTHYGGAIAGPGACRLLERCMAYLQVPTSPDLPLPPTKVAEVLYQYKPGVYGNRTVTSRE
jgi:cell division protein FtsI (penicillin-binding protein 3)